MSASERQRAEWLDQGCHQRSLERLTPRETEELRRAWRRYCEVIAELDDTSVEFEALRTCTDRARGS